MSNGRIVADGTIDQIRDFFGNECLSHVIKYSVSSPVAASAFDALPGIIRVEPVQPSMADFAVRVTTEANGAGLSAALRTLVELDAKILACDTETASLEDLFFSVIQQGNERSFADGKRSEERRVGKECRL